MVKDSQFNQIHRLYMTAGHGRHKWKQWQVLTVPAILETFQDPAPVWRVCIVARCDCDDAFSIDSTRKAILDGCPGRIPDPGIDITKDTWTMCVATEVHGKDEGARQRGLAVEILDPYELFDGDGILCKHILTRPWQFLDSRRVCELDLTKMGLIP